MATDSNHITNLGSYPTLDAVWAAHPEGGRDGDYLTINGIEYCWDGALRQWVSPASSAPSGTLDEITSAITHLRSAVSALQTAVAAKCDTGIDGRVARGPRVVVRWMGDNIDGALIGGMSNGDIWFDENDQELRVLVDNDIKPFGEPDEALVYCSQVTGKLYRWRTDALTPGWHRVGNDVTDALDSNKTDSGLSARQGAVLNAALSALTDTVTTLKNKVESSLIGDRASSRFVIDDMSHTPPGGNPGTAVTVLPGGGFGTTSQPYVSAPPDMNRDYSLRYNPNDKKLYYYYKVHNGEATEVCCSVISPDPQLIYWDASDPENERVMRWDADNEEWVYNTTYATVAAMSAALAGKANISDVYTKTELDTAFNAASDADSIDGAISAITAALSQEDTAGEPTPADPASSGGVQE